MRSFCRSRPASPDTTYFEIARNVGFVQIAAGLAAGIFLEITGLFSYLYQLFDRLLRQIVCTAESLGEDRDLRRVLQAFRAGQTPAKDASPYATAP